MIVSLTRRAHIPCAFTLTTYKVCGGSLMSRLLNEYFLNAVWTWILARTSSQLDVLTLGWQYWGRFQDSWVKLGVIQIESPIKNQIVAARNLTCSERTVSMQLKASCLNRNNASNQVRACLGVRADASEGRCQIHAAHYVDWQWFSLHQKCIEPP
jgi:hypothetical protein